MVEARQVQAAQQRRRRRDGGLLGAGHLGVEVAQHVVEAAPVQVLAHEARDERVDDAVVVRSSRFPRCA